MKQSLLILALISIFSASMAYADTSVALKLTSSAGYPFICYGGYGNLSATSGDEYIVGKIEGVYVGFTTSTEEEFKANPNVAWFNSSGQPIAEGYRQAIYEHDGSYKGSMVLNPINVNVPSGMNLVYRVAYQKRVDGDCFGNATLKTQYAESEVLFQKVSR